jgi:rRNA maturation endonuclease Nob1
MLLWVMGAILVVEYGIALSLLIFTPLDVLLIDKIRVIVGFIVGVLMAYEGWRREFAYDWVCSECGNWEIIRRYKFCPKCGGKMIPKPRMERKCPQGHAVPKYAKYCPKCGAKIEERDR